jgi:tetratricopeptide (TPR) repeat protein
MKMRSVIWKAFQREHRRSTRMACHVPVVLARPDGRGATLYATTEDLSERGFSAILPGGLAVGETWGFLFSTPVGEVKGRARVARAAPHWLAGQEYTLCYLSFSQLDGPSRAAVESLLDPYRSAALTAVIHPEPAVWEVSMRRPYLLFALVMVPLVALSLVFFRHFYREEFFLYEIATGRQELTEENRNHLEALYASTLQESYPSTDRLVQLMGALTTSKCDECVDQVTLLLAPRDRRNLDLQIALAQSLDDTQDYTRAEKQYQTLLVRLRKGDIPAERRRDVLLAAARNRVHAGKGEKADEFFHELLNEDPTDNSLRNEFAGALIAAQRFTDAAKLYEGVTPDIDGRMLLISAYAQMKDFAAAENECKKILLARPDDVEAQILLADILSWKGGLEQPRAIYERLMRIRGGSLDLRLRLAQMALWSKRYDEALARFHDLLTDPEHREEQLQKKPVVLGYIDAASMAVQLNDDQRTVVYAVRDYATKLAADEPKILARLAWVFQRLNEPAVATPLLNKALELAPEEPDVRKQLVGALMAAGRKDDAMKLLLGRTLDREGHETLVGYYLDERVKNYALAAEEQRKIVAEAPDDPKARRMLADILSWGGDYDEALRIYKDLAQGLTDDPWDKKDTAGNVIMPVSVRIAEILHWSGKCEESIRAYETLLTANFERAELWGRFVDAAAGLKPPIPDGAKKFLAQISDRLTGTVPVPVKAQVSSARLSYVLLQAGDQARADAMLARAQLTPPTKPEDRRELAGVLAAGKKFAAAVRLYEGIPLQPADRRQLMNLYVGAGQYGEAEKQCRMMLQDNPKDVDLRRQLADVLSWKKDYAASLAILDDLIKEFPEDHTLVAKRCEVRTWSGDYDESLKEMQFLLGMNFNQPALYSAFIDAAASADKEKIDPAAAQVVLRIQEAANAAPPTQKPKLSWPRLAWVLWRLEQKDQAGALLMRLCQTPPSDPEEREELMNVLCAAKKFEEATAIAEETVRKDPQNVKLKAGLANILLWGNRPERAVAIYQELLAGKTDQAELWQGFVDAAASLKTIPPGVGELAVKIAERQRAVTEKQGKFLIRLAWVLHLAKEGDAERRLLEKLQAAHLVDSEAVEQLTGVLEAAGMFKEAHTVYQTVIDKDPGNPKHAVRLASIELGNKEYDKALTEHERLLDGNIDQPALWKGFAAAGANAAALTDNQVRMAEAIGSRLKPADDAENVELLYTLSWLFARASEPDLAGIMIDRAAAAPSQDVDARQAIASMLIAYSAFERARTVLESLLPKIGNDEKVKTDLALVILWCHKYDEAAARFQALLEENFDRPKVWPFFIDAAASAKDVNPNQAALAVKIARHPSTVDSKEAHFLSRLAWVCLRGNETGAANVLLDHAIALRPAENGVRKELAGVLTAADRFQDAVTLYSQLERDDKADPELRLRLADALVGAGDYAEALKRYQTMLEANFEQPEAWTGYVSACAKAPKLTDDQRKVIAEIAGRVSQQKLVDPALLSRLAWVQMREADQQGRLDEGRKQASPLLLRAFEMKPTDSLVQRELGNILAFAKKYKEAAAMYGQLKNLSREDRVSLANIFAADEQYDAAEKQMRQAIQERPDDAEASQLLADILSWKKDYVQARNRYQQLLKTAPANEQRYIAIKLARVTLWNKEYAEALVLFHDLLEANRQDASLYKDYIDAAATAAINQTLTAKNRELVNYIYEHRDAIKDSKDPNTVPVTLSRLGWIMRQLKDYPRAIGLLRNVLEMQPNQRGIRLQLAETLSESGRTSEAEQEFNLLLQTSGTRPVNQ